MTIAIIMQILEYLTFFLIVGIAVWAFMPARRSEFEDASRLPFTYDANPVDIGSRDPEERNQVSDCR